MVHAHENFIIALSLMAQDKMHASRGTCSRSVLSIAVCRDVHAASQDAGSVGIGSASTSISTLNGVPDRVEWIGSGVCSDRFTIATAWG
eukprot:3560339-Amphidinium_carterae.2